MAISSICFVRWTTVERHTPRYLNYIEEPFVDKIHAFSWNDELSQNFTSELMKALDIATKNTFMDQDLKYYLPYYAFALKTHNISIDSVDAAGYTALHSAINNNDTDTIQYLIERNASIDIFSPSGDTPLLMAIMRSESNIVNLLINAGANVHQPALRENGLAPIHAAVISGSSVILRMLLEKGARPNDISQDGKTPLLLAASSAGRLDLVNLLLRRGAHVNFQHQLTGESALYVAVRNADFNTVKLLVENGADVNVQTTAGGKTVLDIAVENHFMDIATVLVQAGAELRGLPEMEDDELIIHTLARRPSVTHTHPLHTSHSHSYHHLPLMDHPRHPDIPDSPQG
eukprot:gene1812-3513_t